MRSPAAPPVIGLHLPGDAPVQRRLQLLFEDGIFDGDEYCPEKDEQL